MKTTLSPCFHSFPMWGTKTGKCKDKWQPGSLAQYHSLCTGPSVNYVHDRHNEQWNHLTHTCVWLDPILHLSMFLFYLIAENERVAFSNCSLEIRFNGCQLWILAQLHTQCPIHRPGVLSIVLPLIISSYGVGRQLLRTWTWDLRVGKSYAILLSRIQIMRPVRMCWLYRWR